MEFPFLLQFCIFSEFYLKVNKREIEACPGVLDLIHELCSPEPGLVLLDSLTTLDSNDFAT